MSEIEKETAAAGTAAPAKKGGKKIIVIALLAVLLLAGGGGAFYFWKIAGVEAAASETAKKPEKKSKKDAADDGEADKPSKKKGDAVDSAIPEDEDVKHVVEIPPFIVNLADTEQARYLRMTVSLGIGGEGGGSEKPEALFMTRVRNAMLAVLSEKTSEQLLTAEGKAKLRKELLSAARAASEEPEVKAIYITDFIIQL
jgi:flagellar FliL protein